MPKAAAAPLLRRINWHCHYCHVKVPTVSELVAHVCGQKHARNVLRFFTPRTEPLSRLQYFLDTYVGEGHPLLGLQHIQETLTGGAHPTYMYHCQLCDIKGDWKIIATHLMSEKHLHTYILRNHPNMLPSKPIESKKMRLAHLMKTAMSVQKQFGRKQIQSQHKPPAGSDNTVPAKDPRPPECTKNAPTQPPPKTTTLQSIHKWLQQKKSGQPSLMDSPSAVPAKDPQPPECAKTAPSQRPSDTPVLQSVQKIPQDQQIKSLQPSRMARHPKLPGSDPNLSQGTKRKQVQEMPRDQQMRSALPSIMDLALPTRDPRLPECTSNVQGQSPWPVTLQYPPETPDLQSLQNMLQQQQLKYVNSAAMGSETAMPGMDPWNAAPWHVTPGTEQGFPQHDWQMQAATSLMKYDPGDTKNPIYAWWASQQDPLSAASYPWPGQNLNYFNACPEIQQTEAMAKAQNPWANFRLRWSRSPSPISLDKRPKKDYDRRSERSCSSSREASRERLQGREWCSHSKKRCSRSPYSSEERRHDRRKARKSRSRSRERSPKDYGHKSVYKRCSHSPYSSEERGHELRKAIKSLSHSRERSPKDYGHRSVYKRCSRSPYSSEERGHELRKARKRQSCSRERSTKDYGHRSVYKIQSRSPYSSEKRGHELRNARKSRSCSIERSTKDYGHRSVNKSQSRSIGKSERDSHSGERQHGRKQAKVRRPTSKESSDYVHRMRSHSRETSGEESRSEERHHRKVIDTKNQHRKVIATKSHHRKVIATKSHKKVVKSISHCRERLPKTRSEELVKPKNEIHKKVTKAKKKQSSSSFSSSSSSSGESSDESFSSEKGLQKKHNQEQSSPHYKVKCEETAGECKKNKMPFDDLQNVDIEDEEVFSCIREIIQNCTNDMKRFLQEAKGLTRDPPTCPTPAEPETLDISVSNNEQLTANAEQCFNASTSEVISRDHEPPSPQNPTPGEPETPDISVSDNEQSSRDAEQHNNTSTPEIIPRDHEPAYSQMPDPPSSQSSPDRTNSESDSETAAIGDSSHSGPASIFQESFGKKIIQDQEEQKVTVVKTEPEDSHHYPSVPVSDSHPEAALNSPFTGGSHAGSPRLPLNPLPTNAATEMFFSSIKNLKESEVIAVFHKISATNPAFRCINIPALIHFLKATGKLKKI